MDLGQYRAYLFDLDGVITPTADLHRRAWAELFSTYLGGHPGAEPYSEQDYYAHLDGKPRYQAVADLLDSRGLGLPWGDPDDSPDAETVCGLGNRKNEVFNEVLERDGVTAYPGTMVLLERLVCLDVELAVVSSSKNAGTVLRAAGLADYFPVVVDGVVAAREELAGKPAPDTFLRAARLLNARPEECVVLEDATSGVAAAAAGGFGLVVGVDRGAGREALVRAGADVVVADLKELVG